MTENKIYSNFDILKYILSLIVVTRHSMQLFLSNNHFVYKIFVYGISNIAVPSFFVISGFLFFNKNGIEKMNFKVLFKYIFRLFRVYVIWSIIYLLIALIDNRNHNIDIDIKEYFIHFFFYPDAFHLWYLPSIIVSIFLVGIFLKWKIKPRSIFVLSVILYVLGYIGDNKIFYMNLQSNIKNLYILYLKVFLSTRNGFFYGLLFVSIGLLFLMKKPKKTNGLTLILFFYH